MIDFGRLLDCVAISNTLDAVLMYGASGAVLESFADELDLRLRATGAADVDRVWLGSAETEDTLWGIPGLPQGWGGKGLLLPPNGTTRIVIVPDLARLSLSGARAAVVVLGSGLVHVERRGDSRLIRTHHRWLVGLAREDRGSVSRHLLDRFPIQMDLALPGGRERSRWLASQVAGTRQPRPEAFSGVAGAATSVRIEPSAIEETVAYTRVKAGEGMRSAIALLRLAEAMARLDRKETLDGADTRAAAEALGWVGQGSEAPAVSPSTVGSTQELRTDSPLDVGVTAEPKVVIPAGETWTQLNPSVRATIASDILAASESELEGVLVPVPEPMGAEVQTNEYTSLRLPWRQVRAVTSVRGVIVGTRRADSLRDLAITDTLLAAGPYQPLRRKRAGPSKWFILRRGDLRSYRRAPSADDLLVIVLDYTSMSGPECVDALVPFLAEAYALRSEVCFVRVGSAAAANPLRADRVVARNVLVPSVAAALDERAGTATPLADGLSLAFRTIRETLGHGRTTARHATLIVVTDGRGNIPLDASREGRVTARVGRKGAEDAQTVARDLRELPHVRRVLIDPCPDYLRDLPRALAAALGAEIVTAERRNG